MVQLSHPYMTMGKTTALTIWIFVGKIMSLLFNILSRFVIAILRRSKRLLISWLQSPSAVILEPPKIKSVPVSQSSPKLMSIKSVMPSSHLILYCPLLVPSIFPSIRVFSNESALCTWWPNYWSFIFSISPSSEHSGLISSWIDWFDFLAVQGTLKNLLQHQFKSISYSAFSLLYGPTLTSVHDYWKERSFDYMDFCQQSDIFAF